MSEDCENYDKGRLLKPPNDTSLPMFVYGFLKPGELAYSNVSHHLSCEPSRSAVGGVLYIRDGLPLLAVHGSLAGGIVNGFLLRPSNDNDYYEAVCKFEPRDQYRWVQVAVQPSQSQANVLVGKRPMTGSLRYYGSSFSGYDDIVLTRGPIAVADALLLSKNAADEISEFFHVQMAYMFLWSIIERFAALRYGPWLEPGEKIRKLSTDAAWHQALSGLDSNAARVCVVDSRDPKTSYIVDPDDPLKSLRYFYQFRCNLTHRGKGAATVDTPRLRMAADELLQCMLVVWRAYGLFSHDDNAPAS